MTRKAKSILEAALTLTAADRGRLAGQLFDSLPPPPGFAGMSDRAFSAELRRRDQEMENQTDAGLSWSRVRKMR